MTEATFVAAVYAITLRGRCESAAPKSLPVLPALMSPVNFSKDETQKSFSLQNLESEG